MPLPYVTKKKKSSTTSLLHDSLFNSVKFLSHGDAFKATVGGTCVPTNVSISSAVSRYAGGSSFYFSSSSSVLTLPPIANTSGAWTLEFSIYLLDAANLYFWAGDPQAAIVQGSGNFLLWGNSGSTRYSSGATQAVTLGTWFDMAITGDGGSVYQYFVNGNRYAMSMTIGSTGYSLTTPAAYFGASGYNNPRFYLDEIRVTSGVRYASSYSVTPFADQL